MKRGWRRKRLLVDRLQLHLVSVNLLYTAAIVAVFVAVVFGPLFWAMLDRDADPEARLVAADRMIVMHESLWPPVIVVMLLFIWHTLVYAHRIAGPLYRFRKVFSALEDGDLSVRAGIRERDFLDSECEAINAMRNGLRERISSISATTASLDEATRALRRRMPDADPELTAAYRAVREQLDELVSGVDRFTLDDSGARGVPATAVEVRVPLPGSGQDASPALDVSADHRLDVPAGSPPRSGSRSGVE